MENQRYNDNLKDIQERDIENQKQLRSQLVSKEISADLFQELSKANSDVFYEGMNKAENDYQANKEYDGKYGPDMKMEIDLQQKIDDKKADFLSMDDSGIEGDDGDGDD